MPQNRNKQVPLATTLKKHFREKNAAIFTNCFNTELKILQSKLKYLLSIRNTPKQGKATLRE